MNARVDQGAVGEEVERRHAVGQGRDGGLELGSAYVVEEQEVADAVPHEVGAIVVEGDGRPTRDRGGG